MFLSGFYVYIIKHYILFATLTKQKYDLRKIEFLIYGIYIAIYTLLYFNIKKIKMQYENKSFYVKRQPFIAF